MLRLGFFLQSVISMIALLGSYYFEYVKLLHPCPLCLMQRYCVMLLILTTVFRIWQKKTELSSKSIILFWLFTAGGIYFSTRQLWLQSLPADQVPSCLPDLSILIHYFPLQSVLSALFLGAADCAQSVWSWFGITLAGWSLSYFIVMAVFELVLYGLLKAKKNYHYV